MSNYSHTEYKLTNFIVEYLTSTNSKEIITDKLYYCYCNVPITVIDLQFALDNNNIPCFKYILNKLVDSECSRIELNNLYSEIYICLFDIAEKGDLKTFKYIVDRILNKYSYLQSLTQKYLYFFYFIFGVQKINKINKMNMSNNMSNNMSLMIIRRIKKLNQYIIYINV